MSTCFFWKTSDVPSGVKSPTGEVIEGGLERGHPKIHIGKRSAAGLYCWNCRCTLCAAGEEYIHYSRHNRFLDHCPRCGSGPTNEQDGPVAVELGWSEGRQEAPTGVRGTSSFTWAQEPAVVRRTCEERMDESIVVDEYGTEMTGREFLTMLRCNCAVEYLHLVGKWFS